MSNESFNLNKIISDSKDVLLNPKAYFASMKTEGGLGEPVIKALFYGLIAGIFALLWSLLKVGAVAGGVFGSAVGFMAFLWAIIWALIGLFIGAVIVLVISAICGGKTDFEPTVRVTASLMVLMPISAFFGFASSLSSVLGSVISLAINLYGLWMLYHALVQTLKAKESTTRIIGYVLLAIVAIMFIIGLTAKRAANKYMERLGTEPTELLDSYKKEIEKGTKEMQKEADKMDKTMEKLEESADTL